MNKELRTIADQMRKHLEAIKTDATFRDSPYYQKGVGGWWEWDASSLAKHMPLLARAFLEEHPADDETPVDEEWLRSVGFLPNGDDLSEFARKIWSKGDTEDYGDKPAMHFLWSIVDHSAWLEAYGTGGETLCLVELATKNTRGAVRLMCRSLGIELKVPT